MDCENLIKRNLIKLGFDEGLLQESKNWTGNKSFNLTKNNVAVIPQLLTDVRVGLGWDTRCDIDSSVILMDSLN